VLKQRIFSNYYRVAFVGSRFGPDLDGKEFIYKEANTVRVTDVTEHMKKTYSDGIVTPSNHSFENLPHLLTKDLIHCSVWG
jgi:hypothetical protein